MPKQFKNIIPTEQVLFNELSTLIEQSQQQVAAQANSTLTLLFWHNLSRFFFGIGNRINNKILQNKRADYGKQIVSTLSTLLKNKYGKNFEMRNVQRMMQFAEQFDDNTIVVTLSRQLSWSHFVTFKLFNTL